MASYSDVSGSVWIEDEIKERCAPFFTTVKPGFYVPWIYIFLDSTHILIGPAKTSIRAMLNFPGIYVCAFCPIPRLYVQTEHKLACSWCFKYFQLEFRKKKMIFSYNFLSSLLPSRHLLFYDLKVVPAEWSRVYRCQACVVTNDVIRVWNSTIKSLCVCCFVNLLRIKLANSFTVFARV
jgi:hypothetical protein